MGGGGGNTKATSSTAIKFPPFLEDRLRPIVSDIARDSALLPANERFEGPFIAGNNEYDTLANQIQLDFINSQQGVGQKVQDLADRTIGGEFLDFTNTEAFQNFANQGVINPMMRNVQDTILPAVQSQAVQGGAFGGSRNAVAETLAFRDAQNAAGSALAREGMNLFLAERARQNAAPGLFASAAELGQLPASAAGTLATDTRLQEQRGIDESRAQFEEQFLAPFRNEQAQLQVLMPLLGMTAGQIGQTQQSGGGPGRAASAIAGGLGLGASGALLGSLIGGGGGAAAAVPIGALGGSAALGALGGGGGAASGAATGAAAGSVVPGLGTIIGGLLGLGLGAGAAFL